MTGFGLEKTTEVPVSKYDAVIQSMRDYAKPNQPIPPAPQSQTDRELLMREIDSLCKRKNITPEVGAGILNDLYGVKARSQLSDEQLVGFRDYLAMRPSEVIKNA